MKEINRKFNFSETISFDEANFERNGNLKGLKDVIVEGDARFDIDSSRLYVDMTIHGTMIVPCALSLENVEVPFETESSEVFSFDKPMEGEDVHEVKGDVVDIRPIIFQLIYMEVPLRVVKEGAQVKRSGKGWNVIEDSQLQLLREDEIDPRLARLKDYFKQDE